MRDITDAYASVATLYDGSHSTINEKLPIKYNTMHNDTDFVHYAGFKGCMTYLNPLA